MNSPLPPELEPYKARVAFVVTLLSGFLATLTLVFTEGTTQLVLLILSGFVNVVATTFGVYQTVNPPKGVK